MFWASDGRTCVTPQALASTSINGLWTRLNNNFMKIWSKTSKSASRIQNRPPAANIWIFISIIRSAGSDCEDAHLGAARVAAQLPLSAPAAQRGPVLLRAAGHGRHARPQAQAMAHRGECNTRYRIQTWYFKDIICLTSIIIILYPYCMGILYE